MMQPLVIISFILYYFMLYTNMFWLLIYLDNRHRIFVDPKPPKKLPKVSIIIPAYNEEKYIKRAIESCLKLNYPKEKLEIIVVNDGSTDNTGRIAEEYAKKGLIKLINKSNTGKGDSLNIGLKHAKGEIVACLDADSYFTKNAIINMIGYFKDPKVAAVTSTLKTVKPKNLLQKIQWMEYLFSIYLRKLMSFINAIYVIPGPGGLYRKKVVEEVGGFDPYNLVEDTDIALKIQSKGYKIENSVNAVVYTEIPSNFFQLLKQRLRWYGGYFENILGKHRKMLFSKISPNLTIFLLPTNFIWLFALFFFSSWSLHRLLKTLVTTIINVLSVRLDVLPLVRTPEISLIQFANLFLPLFVIFYLFTLTIVLLSISTSKEKLNLKKNWFRYLAYILLYFPLLYIFWTLSIFYPIFRSKRRGGWRK